MSKPIKILFLAANPLDTTRLMLDEEARSIEQALLTAGNMNKFSFAQKGAIRITDLQQWLLYYQPHIVHFSGHGNPNGGLIINDDARQSVSISADMLGELFAILKDNVRCVILNACFTQRQADTIAEHVDCVVGMPDTVEDKAAISFSAAFYLALGFGRDLKTAFDLGCFQIAMNGGGKDVFPKLISQQTDLHQLYVGPSEYDEVILLIEDHFSQWSHDNYSGRGDRLIKYEPFVKVNKHRHGLKTLDDRRLAYLLRCGVQNGMGGQWGKWLLLNKHNVHIVKPLVAALDQTVGFQPAWRAAFILECTVKQQIEFIADILSPEIYVNFKSRQAIEAIKTCGVIAHLERIAEEGEMKSSTDALNVLGEIHSFSKDVKEYKQEQTISAQVNEIIQNGGRLCYKSHLTFPH